MKTSRLTEYVVALASVTLAILLRYLVNPWVADRVPLVTLFGAVALNVWFGGWRPALVVAVPGYLACTYLFAPPRGLFPFDDIGTLLGMLLYGITCAIIIGLGEEMRSARRRDVASRREALERLAEAKRAAQERHESEERFRLMADAAPVLIWVSGADKLCTWFNQPWLDFVGRTMEQEIGNGWADGVHPDDRDQCVAAYCAAFDAHVPFGLEYRLRRHDGEYRWLWDQGTPRFGVAGEFTGYIGSCMDITDRKRAEEAHRAAQEQLQLVTDSMSVPVTRCGRDLTYLWVSKPYTDWIGRASSEVVGRPIAEVIGDEAFERLRPYFERVLAGEQVHYEEEVPFAGLGPRWIHAVYTPTYDARGTPDGWVAAVVDIDARKRAEEALKEADRRKDEFLATLAHELRNPLAPIRTAVQILREQGPADPALVSTRDMIDRNVQQMVRLIDDLLDVNRISHNKLHLRREWVDLATAIASAVETSRPIIESSRHALAVELPSEPLFLYADPTRIAQIFANLLNNAAKFTEPGGRISLRAARDGGEAVIVVADSGIGLAAEQLPRLFEMFAQLAPALERSHGGLGIGLALVRGLVEMHGGSVGVRSDGPGRGSEFIVRLPLAGSPADEPARGSGDGRDARSQGRRRVLIVDDNADAVESLGLMLSLVGHDVFEARDGIEALRLAEEVHPDAIILDIGMPKMNGYDTARAIRECAWGRNVMLLALTGWGHEEDRRRAIEAGFDHHLTKPVDLEQLLERLTAPSRAAKVSTPPLGG